MHRNQKIILYIIILIIAFLVSVYYIKNPFSIPVFFGFLAVVIVRIIKLKSKIG